MAKALDRPGRMTVGQFLSWVMALPDGVPALVIVVEALLPRTATRDTGAKLADYFGLPSARLIVRI